MLVGGARGTPAGGCFIENELSDIFVFLYSLTVYYFGILEGALFKAVSNNEFVSISSLSGVLDRGDSLGQILSLLFNYSALLLKSSPPLWQSYPKS